MKYLKTVIVNYQVEKEQKCRENYILNFQVKKVLMLVDWQENGFYCYQKYIIYKKEIFNPNYALFMPSANNVTF